MEAPLKKILVYLDGTEESVTAARYAICMAKAFNASLRAIYVVNTRALSELLKTHIFIEDEQAEYQQDLEDDAKRYLAHVRNLGSEKGLEIDCIDTRGTVHQEIRKYIFENSIDLLILGELSHLRSRRDEFYNETERAMRSSPCSVLIVKDRKMVEEQFEKLV